MGVNPFIQFKTVVGQLCKFRIIKDERLVSKRKAKLIFQAPARRLSGTGIVECLEIIEVGCNLKQFDGLT